MKNRNSIPGRHCDRPIASRHPVNLPLVEIYGYRRVLVEQHQGILSYDPNQVHIKTKMGTIIVSGEKLVICKMCADQLVIAGRMDAVTLMRSE